MSYRQWSEDYDIGHVKFYLLGSYLYIELDDHYMYRGLVSRPVSEVYFLYPLYSDRMYREGLLGYRVEVDYEKIDLDEPIAKHNFSKLIPDGYDHELLAQIKTVLGEEEEVDYDNKEIRQELTDLTLEHARLVKIVQDQPQLIDLIKEIDRLKQRSDRLEEELEEERKTSQARIKKLEKKLDKATKENSDLSDRNQVLEAERSSYKQQLREDLMKVLQ